MAETIAVPAGPSDRIFPPIGPNLYEPGEGGDDPSPERRAARSLLALGRRPMKWSQIRLGLSLDAAGRVARVLRFHREALAAELDSRWTRADFFWEEFQVAFGRMARDGRAWDGAIGSVAGGTGEAIEGGGEAWRRRLVDEIFIPTHRAFCDGRLARVTAPKPSDRAFSHLRRIERLLPLSGLGGEALREVIGPPSRAYIDACLAAKSWGRATRAAEGMRARFPDRPEELAQVVAVRFAGALGKLRNGGSRADHRRDSRSLRRSIKALEALRKSVPDDLGLFQALAQLHHIRAVKLASAVEPSRALEAVERAIRFNPSLEDAHRSREQIRGLIANLQAQVKQIQREVASRPNARLNEEGRRLVAEARRGTRLAEKYASSAEAAATVAAYRVAHARFAWRKVGLPSPPDRPDERAEALLSGLLAVINSPPAGPEGLGAAWEAVAEANPDLAGLEPAPIVEFLRNRIFGGGQEAPAGLPADDGGPPALVASSQERRRSSEPFLDWVFSRQGAGIKARAIAAVLLVAGGLAIADRTARGRVDRAARREAEARDELARLDRDHRAGQEALDQVARARDAGDDLGVIRHAEAFLGLPAPIQGAARARVLGAYQRALVRWFAGLDGPPDAEARARLDRYRTLVSGPGREGGTL
jgi:hypothetical protein